MKKITFLKSLLVVMALSLFSFSAVAEEVISNTFTSTTMQASVQTYTDTWDNVSGTTLTLVNFNNNKKGWAYVKCGRKADASVATIKTKSALTEKVTKVVVTIDDVLDASKVNATYLEVATDAAFTQNVQKTTVTIAKGALTYNVATPAENCYYRLTYDCASHGSKNGIIQISKVDFYYEGGGSGNEGGEEPTPDPEEPVVPEGPQTVTIAEFLTKSVSADVYYELTGVISNITNTSYGNFDLTDATGSVYVYGLKENETAGKQTFANLGLVAGDTLTLRGVRAEYNSKAQVGNAYYVSHKDYVAPEGGEEPTPDPEEPENNTEYVDELGRIVYPFGNHTDFASWTNSYSARSFDYKGATVSFESANKQSGTITDIPVTKGNYVQLELKDATKAITSVRLVCRQWNTKAQTITLNAGTSVAGLTNTNITSSNFVLETNELPINSSVVRFTFSSKDNQIGIDSIYYTIGDKEAVAIEQPTVSVVGGEKYEAFDVELTCATEGAEVYYTLNGGAETKYTAAINIAATTELKTWSVKGSDKSDNLVVNYTFPTSVADIAALIADASGKNVRINGAVTVLAQTGKYLWVKDASASMLVYGTAPAEYNNGDQLIGLVGKVSTYSGAKQIVPAYFPAAVAGTTVEPTIVALTDVTANTVHQYIRLENVTYTNATTLTVGDKTLAIFEDRFNYVYDGAEGDTVDVIAIVGLYNGTVQVYPISIVKAEAPKDPVNVENAVVANIYTLGGMIVAEGEMEIFTVTGQNVTDMNGSLEKGIYVVRTANATAKVVVK